MFPILFSLFFLLSPQTRAEENFHQQTWQIELVGLRGDPQAAVISWEDSCRLLRSDLERSAREYPNFIRNPRVDCGRGQNIIFPGIVTFQFASTASIQVEISSDVTLHANPVTGPEVFGITTDTYNRAYSGLNLGCDAAYRRLRDEERRIVLLHTCHRIADIGSFYNYRLSSTFQAMTIPRAFLNPQTARGLRRNTPSPETRNLTPAERPGT